MSKIGISGVSGRMGRTIYRMLLERNHSIGCGFEAPDSKYLGTDTASLLGESPCGVTINTINADSLKGCDVIIDFTSEKAGALLLDVAIKANVGIVIGTTGISDAGVEKIKKAAESIPVLYAPNMSFGVNLFFKILERAAELMPEGYDVEIFESHHKFKKDSPSGTAVKMIQIIKNGMKRLKNGKELHGREGLIGERTADEIGVHAMRGGDIVGEHTVYFVGMGERLEISHRATSRDMFAIGAVKAAEYLVGKKPGLYSIYNVLGL